MMPMGYRFVPTDVELICYLWEKVYGEGLQGIMKNTIVECDLYGSESPREIFNGTSATELYFFTVLKKKFGHGERIDRTVGAKGTWKMQNNGKHEGGCKIPAIYDLVDNSEIGYRKNLSFAPPKGQEVRIVSGKKESWVMHEYTLRVYPDGQDVWALCRIIKKNKSDNNASSSSSASVSSQGLEENEEFQPREKRPRATSVSTSVPMAPSTTSTFNETVTTTPTYLYGNLLQQDHNHFSASSVSGMPMQHLAWM
ncbi:hypothetical protein IFM89_009902 [Coptis chinensis]|uniref:NAC domain-containing protein n=1 Tax=Coptis chinensis TaxID=261450 RepID=A0A835HZG9_9MAGN|nr:hypothetical protein IFM89_009902 [Coptis chinensis]